MIMDRETYDRIADFIVRVMLRLSKKAKKGPVVEPTQLILTVWKRKLLSENWIELIDGFDAVSIKCVDGDALFGMQDAEAMAGQIRSAGKQLHGWGFHYCTSEATAMAEARAAAKACKRLKCKAYHWNAEKHWNNAPMSPFHGKVFAQEFKAHAPDVFLFANCFHASATTDMLVFFDAFEPMCYGTKASTIASKVNSRMGREDLPADKKAIMVGTGRLNPAVDGQSWGYFETNSDDVPGLIELAIKHRPLSINFFRGGVADGEDIMVAPNKNNPSLSEQAVRIREALDQVEAT